MHCTAFRTFASLTADCKTNALVYRLVPNIQGGWKLEARLSFSYRYCVVPKPKWRYHKSHTPRFRLHW